MKTGPKTMKWWFFVPIALMVLFAMLAWPRGTFRSSYEDVTQCATCGGTFHTTVRTNGIPYEWLTREKQVRTDFLPTESSQTSVDNLKLFFDVLTWGVVVAATGYLLFAAQRTRRNAHLRH